MVTENARPMRAAKRLGGKYTGLTGSLNRCISQSLTMAKGLNFPKSKERKEKSMIKNTGANTDAVSQ